MNPQPSQTRRNFLSRTSLGLGTLALSSISQDGTLLGDKAKPKDGLHFPAKAKRVIYLHMSGGPSHLETFDNTPQ